MSEAEPEQENQITEAKTPKLDFEMEGEDVKEELQQSEADECADDPECVSLGFRDGDGEMSLELSEPLKPLSQETRNLTASELLLNK